MSPARSLCPYPPDVVAIVGPTATGKSQLAIALAQRFDGEIVNADSMQLYRGLDIGTAKLPEHERGGIAHHVLDIWPLHQVAAVAQYQAAARAAITAIRARGHLPILAGGSGLYVRAALDDLQFPPEDPTVRARLYAELAEHGPAALHQRLAAVDAPAAQAILPSDGRRIARALEVIELTGGPFTASMPAPRSVYRAALIGLDRDDLAERMHLRVHQMLAAGWLEEIRALLPQGLRTSPTAGKALGYQQLLRALDEQGTVTGDLDAQVAETIVRTRQFARRQRRWFGRDQRITWLDATASDLLEEAIAVAGLRTL